MRIVRWVKRTAEGTTLFAKDELNKVVVVRYEAGRHWGCCAAACKVNATGTITRETVYAVVRFDDYSRGYAYHFECLPERARYLRRFFK